MLTNWLGAIFRPKTTVLVILVAVCRLAPAQQVSLALLQPKSIELASPVEFVEPITLPSVPSHRFWDRQNCILFAANAVFSAADFAMTRHNLSLGGRELNPITRMFAGSTAGLAVNFAGESMAVVGISYFFHKTGHHKLERAASLLNLGSSATAVTFDVVHR